MSENALPPENYDEIKNKEPRGPMAALRWLLIAVVVAGIAYAGYRIARRGPAQNTPSSTAALPTATSAVSMGDLEAPLPPRIIEQIPSPGEEMQVTGDITLVFDQPMDQEATAGSMQLLDMTGTPVEGETTWPSPHTLRFTPAKPLNNEETYTATLSEGAKGSSGVEVLDPMAFYFNTVGPLRVSQVFPADNTIDVANDAVITVIFNRPVVPLVIAEDQAALPQPLEISPALEGKGEWINTSVYAYRAEKALVGATAYKIRIPAGLTNATGEISLEDGFEWQFTTVAPSVNYLELPDGSQNPPTDTPNIPLDETFRISFFQPMDQASVEANLKLLPDQGSEVPFVSFWNEDSTLVTITPTQRLALETTYHLQLNRDAQSASGGQLRDGLFWRFQTVLNPGVARTEPANGGREFSFTGSFRIQFASPMNIESVKERLLISPKPVETVEWWYSEWDYSMWTYGLKPGTTYTVQILPGMQDIYGNVMQQGQVVRFTTGDHVPSAMLQMPYGPAVMRTGAAQEFYAVYRNIQTVSVKLYRLSPQTFVSLLGGQPSQFEYSPAESELVWQSEKSSTGRKNEQVLEKFSLRGADGNDLPQGYYYLSLDATPVVYRTPHLDSRLLIVSSANITFKSTNQEGLVWVTDLQSGLPLVGIPITVYDAGFQQLGNGVTDDKGTVKMDLAAQVDPYRPRYAISEDLEHTAVASSDWGSGISSYDFGIFSDYYSPVKPDVVYLYTERPIYRPGQPVYFKGIIRLDDDLQYNLPDYASVRVVITTFEGKEVYAEDLGLSSYGSFDGVFQLDDQAELGSYQMMVFAGGRPEPAGSISFNVAEYRRPELQVKVSASPGNLLGGEQFDAVVEADFYSGGAVADAEVYWSLTATTFRFTPPDEYSQFSFDDVDVDTYYYFDSLQLSSQLISEGYGRTGPDGRFQISLPADLSTANTGLQFSFEATVTDVAGGVVSDRAVVIGHKGSIYPGVRPLSYVGTAGKEQQFEAIAVDWNGVIQAGQAVDVEILERRWRSVQEQDAQGRVTWTSTVEEIPVAAFSSLMTDERGLVKVAFVPPNGGVFKCRITATDHRGNSVRASTTMWVSSGEFIPWRQSNDRAFQLITDRKSYAPGDTAEILIASPFQGEAYALLTVERGRVRFHEVLKLENNSTVYQLPVTADMAPNVYLSVLIIKGIDGTNPRPNFRVGMAEIKVDTREQELHIEVIPDKAQAGPGDQVNYTVRTTDNQGSPVQAEVSLSLSDLATLSLVDPNSSPILDYFYNRRYLSIWTTVPIYLSLEDYNANIQEQIVQGGGMGSGGGKGGGEYGVIDVRQNFPDTAYWEAHVVTDANGEAIVSVTLPDNLTTWRMDARAVTLDTRVGQVTEDLISTKPLLVRPQTPRFFVVGDKAILGAAIHNNTDQALSVSASLQAEGLSLLSPALQSIEIPAQHQGYVTWQVEVNRDAQRVDLVMSAASGELRDATRPTLGSLDNQGIPVYRYEAPETVGTAGILNSGGSAVEAISLPSSFDVVEGSLTVKVSSSLAASVTDGLTFLEDYPYDCIEQTISRFLPNAVSFRAMKAAGLDNPALSNNLEVEVSTGLQKLYSQQNSDGGWGWWSSEKSDLLTSTYAVLGLVEAREAGFTIETDVIQNGIRFLRSQLQARSISQIDERHELNRQAFVLYTLARADDLVEVSRATQLYDQRQRLDIYPRAFLAFTLNKINANDERVKALLNDIQSDAVLSATGAHWEEAEPDIWNWNTDTRTTAIVLAVLSQLDPGNTLNANAVRWLMSHRTGAHWEGTQETAWSLMALTNWMVASGELQANYQYALAFNGERIAEGAANADNIRQTIELQVDLSQWIKGEANRLAVARTDGPGSLYYTAHLEANLPVDQVHALDRGIILARSYHPVTIGEASLGTPTQEAQLGELLLVRLTLVAPHDLYYVVVDDPMPAGLEAVDQTLLTSQQGISPESYRYDDLQQRGWGWWYFDHAQMKDEKVVLSAAYLPAGTYIYTYLVRASTSGDFSTIPPTAYEFYFPEVYGRGEGSVFTVKP